MILRRRLISPSLSPLRREAEKQEITASKAVVVKQNKEKRMKLDKLDDQLKEMHSVS